jgi:hypothetical protein
MHCALPVWQSPEHGIKLLRQMNDKKGFFTIAFLVMPWNLQVSYKRLVSAIFPVI